MENSYSEGSIKKAIAKNTKKIIKKKSISFAGDKPKNCAFCKKCFDTPNLLKKHHNGNGMCALKHKLERYKENFDKLKTASLTVIAEKDLKIAELTNTNNNNSLGLSQQWQDKLKSRLGDFYIPSAQINKKLLEKYQTITSDPVEQSNLLFKKFINGEKGSKPLGIFITNSRNEYGLVVKCNGELYIDTQGLIMALWLGSCAPQNP
jgi:hypothetical protein